MREFLDSICNEVSKAFPSAPIYVEEVPANFKRLSFYVQAVTDERDILTKRAREDSATFQIVCFSELNAFLNVDAVKQADAYDLLKEVFGAGVLPIVETDRVAKINGFRMSKRDAEIYVNMDISLSGLRAEDGEPAPPMQNIHLRGV